MTPKEQLNKWVEGESIHNDEKGECCPDFSCCNKKIHTPKEVRERFAKAYLEDDHKTVNSMLGMFLGGALATKECKVHIATGEEPTEVQ